MEKLTKEHVEIGRRLYGIGEHKKRLFQYLQGKELDLMYVLESLILVAMKTGIETMENEENIKLLAAEVARLGKERVE